MNNNNINYLPLTIFPWRNLSMFTIYISLKIFLFLIIYLLKQLMILLGF